MKRAISAADANRRFSEVLRGVRDGGSYIVTSHGKPIAKIIPIDTRDPVREAAKRALLARLRSQPATKPIGRWTRDDIHER
ncbi:MAG TPA: type II toxin-antitoxin system prevent-host-death family antitoxin [Vicinamibacterales bacterium]|nr:type II toxin-antitoxin system prevent-host-death family antitoxin [Vicinamibacterales bacterium]